jgi:predicted PurR-regulated permease PerM
VFALVQFESFTMAALVLATVGGVQLVMGNYVDPLVQGRYMKLSPVVVLLAVTFWGFVWGIAGALIAVPLTVFAVLVCREFESTRFIAELLASVDEENERQPADREPSSSQDVTAPAE